jgi:poly(hydroxyalkanoate) depolymerase family esterase
MNNRTFVTRILGLTALLLSLLAAAPASAQTGSLTEVTSFGSNPSQLRMYFYRPLKTLAKPPVVVAVHWCHGDGMAMYNGSDYARLADQYGFLVIYPSVTQASDGCFDVASTATLTHNGGSDSLGIVSMVKYVLQTYSADATRVYVTGVSSGAMMTNVLLGAYPDVFKAGAAFAGVPFGCFAGSTSWNSDCAAGNITKTAQQWGDLVRAAYPGYTGPRPRMQLWHGTSDEVLNYVNFGEEIKQWTNVLGVSATPVTTEQNTPESNWVRTRYGTAGEGAAVEAISMPGVVHNLPVRYAAAIHFFGLDVTTADTQAPTVPMNLASPSKTSSSVSLTWSASTDNVAVTGYDVYNGTALATSVAGTSATVTGLAANTTYSFTVVARDAAGNLSARSGALAVTTSQQAVDVTAPSTPGTPVASNVTSSSVTLTWSASTDSVGVTGYDVYNGTVLATSVAGTSATVSGLAASTTYSFTVAARDAAGNFSARSGALAVTTSQAGDLVPPTTPGTPVASNVTSSSVTLTWTASTDNVAVVGYDVYQKASSGDVKVASPTTNSASLSGLTANTAYTFYVKARDAAGSASPASPTVTVTTLAAQTGGTCKVSYQISSQWPGGFGANVTITNTGTTAVNGWTLVWTFASGQSITQIWNATATVSGGTVTAKSMSYNATINANGGTQAFGFNGAWTASNPVPASFTLNGVVCTNG